MTTSEVALRAPSEEHRTIRKVVRELAEEKIPPYAAAVDEAPTRSSAS
ncbi:hypothetical protein ACVW00_003336 [Marmoricola sp. URHA0025 HA25]